MQTNLNSPIETELLVRFFSGEANEEETITVQLWMNAIKGNKEHFDQMKLLWDASSSSKDFALVDIKEDWGKVRERITNTEKAKRQTIKPIRRKMIYQRIGVAAIIVVVFSLILVLSVLKNLLAEPVIISAFDNQKEILLPDGSLVLLNKNSRLTYNKEMYGKVREVELEGEAFFEVKSDEEKQFLIKTGRSITKVVGTSFNLRNMDKQVIVTVVSGTVHLFDESNPAEKIVLNIGEQGTIEQGHHPVKSNPDLDINFLSWKTGTLIFRNSNLLEVVKDLNRHYNQSIELESVSLQNCNLTTVFQHQTLEEVLAEIQIVLPIEIQKRGHELIITGEECGSAD